MPKERPALSPVARAELNEALEAIWIELRAIRKLLEGLPVAIDGDVPFVITGAEEGGRDD